MSDDARPETWSAMRKVLQSAPPVVLVAFDGVRVVSSDLHHGDFFIRGFW
jgi:hypothetical protein